MKGWTSLRRRDPDLGERACALLQIEAVTLLNAMFEACASFLTMCIDIAPVTNDCAMDCTLGFCGYERLQ